MKKNSGAVRDHVGSSAGNRTIDKLPVQQIASEEGHASHVGPRPQAQSDEFRLGDLASDVSAAGVVPTLQTTWGRLKARFR